MRHRFVRFLLLVTALWLPVQTMAALSMPLCRHAQEQAMVVAMVHDADQKAEAMPCHEAVAQDQATPEAGCDHCQTCQWASAGFMPSAPSVAESVAPVRHYAAAPVAAPPSHIVAPPQHPPRSIA